MQKTPTSSTEQKRCYFSNALVEVLKHLGREADILHAFEKPGRILVQPFPVDRGFSNYGIPFLTRHSELPIYL